MTTNEYFDNADQTALPRGQTARAEAVDAKFNLITQGFDKLPTVAALTGGTSNYVEATGSGNAYLVTTAFEPTGYTDGDQISFKANHTNTGPATVNRNSLGVKSLRNQQGGALAAGDITANHIVTFIYNDTTGYFEMTQLSVGTMTNVAAVAAVTADVATVAAEIADVSTVAADLGGADTVGTVAGAIANVNLVGAAIADVSTVAGSIAAVNDAEANALAAVAAKNAAELAETNAETAETNAELAQAAAEVAQVAAEAAQAAAESADADTVDGLHVAVLEIGDWNMDTTTAVSVPHGLIATKIRTVSVGIIPDTGEAGTVTFYPAPTTMDGATLHLWWTVNGANIQINRKASVGFDSTAFNSTSFNRGYITIWYTD